MTSAHYQPILGINYDKKFSVLQGVFKEKICYLYTNTLCQYQIPGFEI